MVEWTTSDIIKGLAIGGILLWLITRKSDAQPNNDLQQSGQMRLIGQREQMQIGIYGWKPLGHIQNFDDLMIGRTTFQPAVQSVTQITEQESKTIEQVPKEVEQISNETEYKNKEVWKIGRNQAGDIETIEVERNARVS